MRASVATLLIGAVILVSIFALPIPADAAITVSIDLNRNEAGIQSVLQATPGQAIDAAVVLQLTESSDLLTAYDFSVQFRTDELDVGAASFQLAEIRDGMIITTDLAGQPTPPPKWDLNALPPNPPNGTMSPLTLPSNTVILEDIGFSPQLGADAGIFRDIDAGAIPGVTVGPLVHSIYEFNLTAVNPTGTAADIDVIPVLSANSFLFDVVPLPATAVGASVISATAIPEPSSFALLGIGGLYLGRRHLRRRRLANTS